jgi:hypothetical protein
MITFSPLTKEEIGRSPGVPIGQFYGHEVSAIKEVISKIYSGGNYLQVTKGFGKYGITNLFLQALGYMTPTNEWAGLHGFTTTEAFLHSDHTQEQVMDKCLSMLYSAATRGIIISSTTKVEAAGLLISAYCLGVEETRIAITTKNKDTEWVELYMKMGKQAMAVVESL